MGVIPHTEMLRRYRVHLVERIPYRILESYYLASLAGDFLGKDEGYIPLFTWLREHTGLRAARAFEKINVRMPSAEEALLLNISRSQPMVDMDRGYGQMITRFLSTRISWRMQPYTNTAIPMTLTRKRAHNNDR